MGWYEVYLKDISKKGNLENYVDDKIKLISVIYLWMKIRCLTHDQDWKKT